MNEQLLALIREQDTFAVIEQVSRSEDRLAAAKQLHGLGKHLYWQEKNLPRCIAVLRAGAQLSITATAQDAAHQIELRSAAKAMCYDLASFTWPGWDEPGIQITASDVAIGLDAARANLRLARELGKGDMPLSRAHWMLGAQLLAVRDYNAALQHFERADEYARRVGSEPEALLSAGFAALTAVLDKAGNQGAQAQLEKINSELASLEHGPSFISQIETATRVFWNTP